MPPTPRRRSYDRGGDNGGSVSRAELAAHLEPMRDDIHEMRDEIHEIKGQCGDITQMREDVQHIKSALGAGPRWIGARLTAMIDRFLPYAIAVAGAYLLSKGR